MCKVGQWVAVSTDQVFQQRTTLLLDRGTVVTEGVPLQGVTLQVELPGTLPDRPQTHPDLHLREA